MLCLIVILSWFLHLSSYLPPSKQTFLLLLPSPPYKTQSTLHFPFPNTRKRQRDRFGRKWEWGQILHMIKMQIFLLCLFMKKGKPTGESVEGNVFLHPTYTPTDCLAGQTCGQNACGCVYSRLLVQPGALFSVGAQPGRQDTLPALWPSEKQSIHESPQMVFWPELTSSLNTFLNGNKYVRCIDQLTWGSAHLL